ncbi:glycerate kinase [Francisellaceae bacterium]|nr:glycerate kinase [Francisellaceae bacterium]
MNKSIQHLFTSCYQKMVEATLPSETIKEAIKNIPKNHNGKTIVIGAGKASSQMAKAFEDNWIGDIEGFVTTRYGYKTACNKIQIYESSHPVPDINGLNAAKKTLDLLECLTKDDLVIALISGGGSALLCLPEQFLSFEEKQNIHQQLLASGANISEMNTIRKHLSKIKGGKLANVAHPAKVYSLIISDVPGDNPAMVSSGLTVSDNTTPKDALDLIEKYHLSVSDAIKENLNNIHPIENKHNTTHNIISSASIGLKAVEKYLQSLDYTVNYLGDDLEGESSELAVKHAQLARNLKNKKSLNEKIAILSGGETTVTLPKDPGRGGRNTEYVLAIMNELNGEEGIYAAAFDTDGIDGTEDNAGAFYHPGLSIKAKVNNIEPQIYLDNHDSYSFFENLGSLYIPGPSGTNVNDLRIIIIH